MFSRKILIIGVLLASVFLLAGCFHGETPPSLDLPGGETSTTVPEPDLEPIVKTDLSDIIGEWKSDCLVPDPKSDWAEQHTFSFHMNGQAAHVRKTWYEKGCSGTTGNTATNVYNYKIPSLGVIDFEDVEMGATMYDIYGVFDGKLMFGHGFRNHFPYDTAGGMSPSGRLTSLNQYIVYKR